MTGGSTRSIQTTPVAQRFLSAASRFVSTLLLLLLAASARAQIVPVAKVNAAGVLRPARPAIVTVEKLLDTRLYALGTANDPVDMICCTRGFYLDNFGAVFS